MNFVPHSRKRSGEVGGNTPYGCGEGNYLFPKAAEAVNTLRRFDASACGFLLCEAVTL